MGEYFAFSTAIGSACSGFPSLLWISLKAALALFISIDMITPFSLTWFSLLANFASVDFPKTKRIRQPTLDANMKIAKATVDPVVYIL